MAKVVPQHIQSKTGYAIPARKHERLERAILGAIDRVLQPGWYGTVSITVQIQDGTPHRDIEVTITERMRT